MVYVEGEAWMGRVNTASAVSAHVYQKLIHTLTFPKAAFYIVLLESGSLSQRTVHHVAPFVFKQ